VQLGRDEEIFCASQPSWHTREVGLVVPLSFLGVSAVFSLTDHQFMGAPSIYIDAAHPIYVSCVISLLSASSCDLSS